MRHALLLLALTTLALAGCNRTNLAAAENGGDPMPPAADIAALKGTWTLDTAASGNSNSSNDPKAQLGQTFLEMFNVKVRFKDGAKYKIFFIGTPVDGHYIVEGNRITLIPEKLRGKPLDQVSSDDKAMSEQITEKMQGELAPDRKSVTFHLTNFITNEDQNLVFSQIHRATVQNTLANETERAVAGVWEGNMADAGTSTGGFGAQFAKSMMSNPELELRQDNTFSYGSLAAMEGSWSAQGDKITLIPGKGGNSDLPMSITVSPDRKTLSMTDSYDHTTFVREE